VLTLYAQDDPVGRDRAAAFRRGLARAGHWTPDFEMKSWEFCAGSKRRHILAPDDVSMNPILFKCPATGQNVQWRTEEISSEKGQQVTFKGIACPACTRVHLINPVTGKLLGEK
jgi:hypothetical protein